LSSDPLPLRRAKITQEAAVKKADKATSIAAEARAVSDGAAAAASKSRQHADEQARQATSARHAAEEAARQATAARHAAEQARQAAEASRRAAEAARHEAAQAKAVAEAASEAAAQSLNEAEAYLEEVKAKPGVAQGAIWFMDRSEHPSFSLGLLLSFSKTSIFPHICLSSSSIRPRFPFSLLSLEKQNKTESSTNVALTCQRRREVTERATKLLLLSTLNSPSGCNNKLSFDILLDFAFCLPSLTRSSPTS
jgi:multidrug efflux pump subunit AcrA (membrane-fusion protein)